MGVNELDEDGDGDGDGEEEDIIVQRKIGAGFIENGRRINLITFLRNYDGEGDFDKVVQGRMILDFPYKITNRMKKDYFKVIRQRSKYYYGNTTWLRVPIFTQKHQKEYHDQRFINIFTGIQLRQWFKSIKDEFVVKWDEYLDPRKSEIKETKGGGYIRDYTLRNNIDIDIMQEEESWLDETPSYKRFKNTNKWLEINEGSGELIVVYRAVDMKHNKDNKHRRNTKQNRYTKYSKSESKNKSQSMSMSRSKSMTRKQKPYRYRYRYISEEVKKNSLIGFLYANIGY